MLFDPDEKKTGASPEVADPDAEAPETPAEAGKKGAPEETAAEVKAAELAAGESETTAAAGQKGKQDAETNAKFAKLRRETDEMRNQLKSRDSWVETNFGSQGIHTFEQYQAAIETQKDTQAAETRKKRAEELRGLGIEPELIDSLIESHPQVQMLQRENAQLRRNREDEALVKQFAELAGEFPDIKDPKDIDADTWRKLNAAKGQLTLLEAYTAVHVKDVLANARGAGEQDAVARLAGKDHLKSEKSVGKAGDEIEVHLTDKQLETWATFGYDEKTARARERKRIKERGGK